MITAETLGELNTTAASNWTLRQALTHWLTSFNAMLPEEADVSVTCMLVEMAKELNEKLNV